MHLKTYFSINECIFIYIVNKSNLILSLLFTTFLLFLTFIRSHLAEDNCRERGFTSGKTRSWEWTETRRREETSRALVQLQQWACRLRGYEGIYFNPLLHRFVLAPIPPGLLAHDESFFSLLCDSFLNLPIQKGSLFRAI